VNETEGESFGSTMMTYKAKVGKKKPRDRPTGQQGDKDNTTLTRFVVHVNRTCG
jgi:hypothetical protein